MAKVVYLTISDHINNKPYLLHDIPATYGPVESYFLDEGSAGPLYEPFPGERVSGRYTISAIIDMYFNNVDFTFDSYNQMMEIDELLEFYLKEAYKREDCMNREQKEYISRARALSDFIHTKVLAYKKKNHIDQGNIFTSIYHQYN